jgi:hypothetical protein
MSLEQTLNDTLTQAIRDKDQRMADIVRMIKSRITERRTAKGFSGQIDDAAVLDVISAYRKSLQKALPEYDGSASAGVRRPSSCASRSTSSRGGCPRAGRGDTRARARAPARPASPMPQIGRLLGASGRRTRARSRPLTVAKRIAE